MKKIFALLALTSLLTSSAFAGDFLAKVSNGALSDNSQGVKALNLDEMKQVKGGAISQDGRIAPLLVYGGRQLAMWGIRYAAWGAYQERHPINSGIGIHGWRP